MKAEVPALMRTVRYRPRRRSPFISPHFLLPLAAVYALLFVAIAAAHARYDHSTPTQGEVVQFSPARVEIFTAQELKKEKGSTEITVKDSTGNQVDTGDTTVDDNNRKHFSVGLKPGLPGGRYVVSFKNVSDEDGESDHGQFAFYVGAGPTAQQKALDAKLLITSKSDTGGHKNTNVVLIIGVGAALVILAILVAGGLWYAWRPKRRL